MPTQKRRRKIAIIGAGLGGALMSLCLARRDFEVELYERRPDPRLDVSAAAGPSMNLGLSERGLQALAQEGLLDSVMPWTISMKGRMIHSRSGKCRFQPYGHNSEHAIHAVQRRDLNIALISAAENFPNVSISFGKRCLDLDRCSGGVRLRDESTGQEICATADCVIGADGVFSTVRRRMHHGERANYQQEFLDWGWKELIVPPAPGGGFAIDKNVFHLWPRGGCMMFAHPNLNGSFTCSLVLPFEGPNSFASLNDEAAVSAFVQEMFPDFAPLLPNVGREFLRNPIESLVSTRCSPWYFQDRVVLIGDACHAVFPFYAQGMNAAFEDCTVLSDCLEKENGPSPTAFAKYQEIRKRNTDALADISFENFVELRDRVRSPLLRARRKLLFLLGGIFPEQWTPLHAMVTNTTIPYADAVARARWHNRMLNLILSGILLLILFALTYRLAL